MEAELPTELKGGGKGRGKEEDRADNCDQPFSAKRRGRWLDAESVCHCTATAAESVLRQK